METLDTLRSGIASGRLTGCTHLSLSGSLSDFPQVLFELADSLAFLNLSGNHLSRLPEEFELFKQLKILFFNRNAFATFPTVLAQCPQLSMVSFKNNRLTTVSAESLSPQLRWLILTNNQIESLPSSIGNLSRLQKLMLAGNRLSAVPPELANCKNLELIRLSANRLKALPGWLMTLPRLSWLAYAGNPFCEDAIPISPFHLPNDLSDISASEIQRGQLLGEGASGTIYQGTWTPASITTEDIIGLPDSPTSDTPTSDSPKTVAIKLFKGDITSDGSPLDEMRACMAAGQHPNLVTVLGKYAAEHQAGLVFEFISPDYTSLGDPPDLDSCTRDTYSEETKFTLGVVLTIARGIASAAAHLHRRGILHGDLYAHNILVNQAGHSDQRGHSILGDFGAASFYDPADQATGQALERLESRAFGCLLEDLLNHTSSNESADVDTLQGLRQLQDQCLNEDPAERPLFSNIVHALEALVTR
ncbi:MAG: protein kinase [Cyanobacteria bacterium J06626_6]